jgi:hypothetical protein
MMDKRGSRRFPTDSARAPQAPKSIGGSTIRDPAAAGIGLYELMREVVAFQRAARPLIGTLEPLMAAVLLELHRVLKRRHWI